MDKTQQILFHLDELYTEEANEERILRACEKNPAKYGAWRDAFEEYDLSDVLFAIDEFWQYKSNKTRPNVAQIRAILNAKKAEKVKKAEAEAPVKELSTGYTFWKQDGERGDLKYFLQDYERAFDLCITDYLAEVIPAEEFARMSWQRRIKAAQDNGVLNRMDEALRAVQPKPRFMSDNEYAALHGKAPAANLGDVTATLASHWRVA